MSKMRVLLPKSVRNPLEKLSANLKLGKKWIIIKISLFDKFRVIKRGL